MDAVDFIKERNRMCNYYKSKGSCEDKSCPASYHCCLDFLSAEYDGFKIVDDVEKFSSEHPKKTMLQDFLQKFPYAILDEDNKIPIFCPFNFGYEKEDSKTCAKYTCVECWNRPMEG